MLGAGLLSEAGAVDDHHMLLQNQFLHEDVVAFGNIDSGIGIERAARRDATHARRRIAPLHGEIAAAAQFLADFDQVILRTFERRLDGVLFGMVRAQARTQQL